MHTLLSSSVAGLEQYAVLRSASGDSAESPTPDEIAVLQLFQRRRDLFTQIAALEEEILLRLPKLWWRHNVSGGRGVGLILEMDCRWQNHGYNADDPMRDVIRKLRQFLIEQCNYMENELGIQWALQRRC